MHDKITPYILLSNLSKNLFVTMIDDLRKTFAIKFIITKPKTLINIGVLIVMATMNARVIELNMI